MSCEQTPETTVDDIALASVALAESGGHPLSFRIQTQNDFIWLLEDRVAHGTITASEAQFAFRDYSLYLDAVQAVQNGDAPSPHRG